ncbi:hypothetical protein M758_11G054800 [Ceratodon purpureus]|nr:hypothetical protein M758_11G054800 [Ceratodon purpureus]
MVTMARSCVIESTIWGACLKPPLKCLQTQRTRQCVFRNLATPDIIGEIDPRAENCQPTWKGRLVVSYNGTKYSGWQVQPNSVTIQQKVEDGLATYTRVSRDKLKLVGAGRTDSGVHAWGQVAHFTTPICFDDLEQLHTSLNGILPPDIRIREVSSVQPEFHARYSACRKTYQYRAYVSPVLDPFQYGCVYHIRNPVDVAAMREAASHFVGLHNFSAFANHSTDSAFRGDFREILRFSVLCTGPQLLFEVEGKSFLYKQVRNMVGLLIEIGIGRLPPSIVKTILLTEDRRELAKVSPVAPARHGLYLMSVAYEDKLLEPLTRAPQASFGRWLRCPVCTSV